MSAEAFERYTTGTTLYYSVQGYPYEAEEYLDGRRVRLSFLDGDCMEGFWYPSGDQICFLYEGLEGAHCWAYYERPGGVVAQFEDDPAQTQLVEAERKEEPLYCKGPDVGA